MNEARQRSRRFGRTMGTRTRSAADYSITATLSVVPDPLKVAATISVVPAPLKSPRRITLSPLLYQWCLTLLNSAKAIKAAQDQTDVFLQQQKGAYTEALKNLSELKTLSTVGALTRELEEKRKSEQRAMWGKAVPFYLSLLGFVVIGFLAMGLDSSFVTQEMLREHGMFAYLLPMPRVLIRLWPFCLPLIWCACHFGRLAAQGRRLMEEYAHKVVVAATYSGVAAEVDAMLEKHIMSAADLRVDLMRALINTIGANPNYSLDKIKGVTPLAELTECVSKFSEATREVKGIGAVK